MRQIFQNLSNGQTSIVDVPCPMLTKGKILIASRTSLVSVGTERMLVDFGKANYLDKARQQPDKVKQVLAKIKTDGVVSTLEAVRSKLDQPLPLGYCNAGVALNVGSGVQGVCVGDRIVSNGNHAEVVCVPQNLCVKIPKNVCDEDAAFTVVGAIALQGVRLASPSIGEFFVVTGLGLIGLLTVQILKANGCSVLGIDIDEAKCALAREFGAETVVLSAGEDPITAANAFSRTRGVDGVLITASTKSSVPVRQAARMCRKRGRIVLVGVTGLELQRSDFYEKEISFQVSCSYGPGRYDPEYEEKGHDYPLGFVRWTEQRNFESVLDMMAQGLLNVKPLISHRFDFEDAEKAYEHVGNDVSSLGILLQYKPQQKMVRDELIQTTIQLKLNEPAQAASHDMMSVSFVGAGNYSKAVLIPAFKEAGVRLKVIASNGGFSGVHAGQKFGFEETTTNIDSIFNDRHLNIVVITTRHDSHARLICQSLAAGKHVFVEKPLCLTLKELTEIETQYSVVCKQQSNPSLLMVGFNRRFSPHVQRMKQLLAGLPGPKAIVMTVNAGAIPAQHWTQDKEVGGGRIIGEACHFIDLLRFLAEAPIVNWQKSMMDSTTADTMTIHLTFADGSVGSVHYFANGSKSFPKERLEVFAGGRVLQLDNFRKLRGFGWPGFRKMNLWRQDKGQKACVTAFVKAVEQGSESPIPFAEVVEVSRVAIEVSQE
ncbi:MAG: bi-domain-containing oxidoreductase [Desulfobulbaceae bacterium]|nr:bi-domain-containing oxidoreductase [Desulfobulbaceae bacterium]